MSLNDSAEIRYYSIGGLTIRIDSPAFSDEAALALFSCAEQEPDLHYAIRMESEIAPPDQPELHRELFETYCGDTRVIFNERTGGIMIRDTELRKGRHSVLFQQADAAYFGEYAMLRILNLPRQTIGFGGFFLHASYIVRDGKAVLFTAPKQTGKSTQAALWEKHRGAEIVNGDRALLRSVDGEWRAFGSPYSGTSGICRNKTAPISAIVILSQADENTVRPVGSREAVITLLEGCSYDAWDREQVSAVMDLFQSLITSVPFYHLSCTPDLRAVETMEAVL